MNRAIPRERESPLGESNALRGSGVIRVLGHGGGSGAWNLAVDEALFDHASVPVLRWYTWRHPVVSLGYFQKFCLRPDHLTGLECVRRLTGGGAVVHDRDLTYSLVLPHADRWAPSPRGFMAAFHRIIAQAWSQWDRAAGEGPLAIHPGEATDHQPPFLCFERRSQGDLVQGRSKVGGSAQRIRGGALLQHGSLLLASSTWTPHLAGLLDLADRADEDRKRATPSALADSFTRAICQCWGLREEPDDLKQAERASAEDLAQGKYSQPTWNERR